MKFKIPYKPTVIVVIAIISLFMESCKKPAGVLPFKQKSTTVLTETDSVFTGPKIKVFGGKAWVWIKFSNKGTLKQLAITLTNTVFNTVSFDTSENGFVIPAPPQANLGCFRDFAVEWSPKGHLPAGIYNHPLFDFHFFTITENERQAILADSNYYRHFRTYPAHAYLPQGYGLVNAGGIPGGGCDEGTHWYFLNGPEFKGQTFTQTFVYGTYNGKVNFQDPMVTLNFLKNVQSFKRSIPQPAKFTPNGYYPTTLQIVKHDGITDVILGDFVLRPAL